MSKLTVGDVRKLLEEMDIHSIGGDSEREYEEFAYNSPCGEDFSFTLHYEDNAESLSQALTKYAEGFDPEAHAVSWYVHQEDTVGVPESLKDLLEDAEDIKSVLIEAARKIESAVEKGAPAIETSTDLDVLIDRLVTYFVSDDYSYELTRDELDYVKVDQEGPSMSLEVKFHGKTFRVSAEEVAS